MEGGETMKVIIRFKSGFELPVTCESFTPWQNALTGKLDSYKIENPLDNRPIFLDPADVECIWEVMGDDTE